MRVEIGWLVVAVAAQAQPLRSLKTVPVPEPPGLADLVRDRSALVVLGKVFFWDMQAGSDGRTACATCHFHAGADHRPQNQIADPLNPFPVNRPLASVDFPLRMLSDPANRNSPVLWDSGMRIGSAGSFRRKFTDFVPGQAAESGSDALDKPEFMLGGLQVRRVTSRNAPSVINAVFSVRAFWDGRAQRIFDPGVQDIRLDRSALASQSVGPIMDHLEMSYEGRTWQKLAQKLFSLPPLGAQRVSVNDSVLGSMARADGRGLDERYSYRSLIEAAFAPNLLEHAEDNFPLFWGLAIQAYEATLVSADSPFDRFMEGDAGALTAQEQEGMRLFQTTGRCTNCHGGAEFSAASFSGNNNRAFQRTGVRPASEDNGAGNATFKSIGLRNIEFTGPYFHNGGQSTLEQIVDFYIRAADFTPTQNLRTFRLNTGEKAAMVAFLKALSDDRVRYERAPFDHPELCVPTGHIETAQPGPFPLSAAEKWRAVPAVGAGGNQVPLRTFDEMLRGIGGDGARAHLLDEACAAPLP
jgi:cytochrome c peroxidase